MNIGIDIRNIGRRRTGDEVVFLNLVRELLKIDRKNEYLLFIDERTDGDLRELARRLGMADHLSARFVCLPARNKFDWNAWWLPRYLRTHVVDVYHTQYIVPLFVPKRTKVVTHIHDVSFRAYPQYISLFDRWLLKGLIPQSLRRADRVIAPSEFTKQEIIKYYAVPEKKITVIYNAVAPEFFRGEEWSEESDREHIDATREKYHLPKRFFLYVGTLQPRKNIPMLLEAFDRFRKRNIEGSDIKLVLVGNRQGHHFDSDIDDTVARLGRASDVLFPGFIDQEDLPILMGLAMVFVFPSYYEGFGIPILEAMSRGVPVVASDIPALREAGGDAALFVAPDEGDRFVEVLQEACFSESVREKLREKGLVRARDFSWEKSARDLLVTYEKICFHEKTVS